MSNLSRRSLAKGAAWTAPAVALTTAAPAASASTVTPCAEGPVTVNLGAGTRTVLATGASGMPSQVQWTYTDAATGATVTITSTAIGNTILGRRTGYAIDSYEDTSLAYNGGFNIQHVTNTATAPGTGGEGESVTIAFSRNGDPLTVSNFSMNIEDIDSKGGNWTDGVVLTSGPVVATKGADLDGNGTAGAATYNSGPWHKYTTNGSAVNAPGDRVSLTAAAIDSLSFDYINVPKVNGMAAAGSNSDQNIQLTSLTFQAPGCSGTGGS